MKTIIFGGSFDPIHNSHIKIAKKAKEYLSADQVVFLIAKKARWKDTKTNNLDRLNMLEIALKDYPWAKIDLEEFNQDQEVNYTYETMLKLKNKYSGELYFLIGSDQEEKLHDWYKIDELSKLVKIICVTRPNYSLNYDNINKYNVDVITYDPGETSSSDIRLFSSLDCPYEVLMYIAKHKLYQCEIISSYINEKRYKHSVSVASLCYTIAKNNAVDENKAFLSGLIHDIGKDINDEILLSYMKENYPNYIGDISKQLFHQFYGVKLAKEILNINDEEILEAIKYHATGKDNMTKLGKIVYVADKTDPLRGYDSKKMIEECIKDIDKGFIYVLDENIKFLKENNKNYSNSLTMKCIEYYLK